ncbi:putative nuclease HARBI1 [Saccostrea echinata]|uniref:putative nuclease HARBI1 n=1 Tax=Saccostrea echinata TaxID=191078 RepID=UPI002A823424|nr:putative nuclease HARBI1 [Saccostrea echinata]
MAEVEIDDNVVFAVLLCSYVIAMEEEEEQQINNVQPHQKRVKRAAHRQFWVRPWLTEGRRQQFGHFSNLLDSHLRLEDPAAFQNYTRLTPELFDEVLQRITPEIEREVTSFRQPLSPALKLAVTLRHLATGDGYRSLAYAFRCVVSSISKMIPEVCQAIVQAYKEEVFSLPVSPEAWKALAVQFEQRWNVPHAVGALDGKHIAIKKPPQTGSMYFNYKGFFSIPLLALVDACYKFVWIELGGKGHMSDTQIFGDSELFNGLEENALGLPPPCPLTSSPDDFQDMPFFILGDDAFALRNYLMKPYSRRQMSREERIYNYRISRGRRVVENAFGILANRFMCLLRTLEQKTDTVKDIVEATVILHNLLRLRHPGIVIQEVDHEDLNHDIIPGAWRDQVDWPDVDQPNAPRNTATGDGKYHRELLKKFFSSPQGAVDGGAS